MDFCFKDFEDYYFTEIKGVEADLKIKTIKKVFVFEDKILILRKCRSLWQIVQSAPCGFTVLHHFKTFDLIFNCPDELEANKTFISYVNKLCEVIFNELY